MTDSKYKQAAALFNDPFVIFNPPGYSFGRFFLWYKGAPVC